MYWGPDPNNAITPRDTSSAASFANALGWIQICDQQHKSCNRTTTPLLPTQILNAAA
ncbi:hypothetical protein N431DRAFT_439887 [Stipitochalara longipes BDJ]|nr:hypothetical protein N431DRAFT_439887 [Stipitochalara longipes BDJ]